MQNIAGGLYGHLGRKGQKLFALDATVTTVFGEPESARQGYNPHQPGRLPCHPRLIFTMAL